MVPERIMERVSQSFEQVVERGEMPIEFRHELVRHRQLRRARGTVTAIDNRHQAREAVVHLDRVGDFCPWVLWL